MRVLVLALVTLALIAGTATAGSAEEPEATDAAGDCEFEPGNDYMDITAAWISDESSTDFMVNVHLAKWDDLKGHAAAFTVQFEHQGKQWGVVGMFDRWDGQWLFGTGLVEEGAVSGFESTTGTFTPGEPAHVAALFPKDLFSHNDANDNELRNIHGGTADFKPSYPGFIVAGLGGPFVGGEAISCDVFEATSSYAFQVGGHAAHQAEETADDTADDAADDAAVQPAAADPAPGPAAGEEKATPGPGAFIALAAVAVAVAARRR